ncbi:type IV pilin protein [Prochlorococcus marinus]|uniref:type IV pilin protein n=1 Tax=Prochlorococcus marinus TaxID=1219 RepID=UPI0009413018|nr:prepilin-type N-terminal cleavage/methylation domain-containing protein [Prochlorococcus marinus]
MKSSGRLPIIKKLLSKREKGFSLIELVVVVAVLGVLSAVAIPSFNAIILKARQAGAASHVDALLKSAVLYKINFGRYPSNWNEISMYYSGGLSNSSYETCTKYGSACNGSERVVLNGQYLINYFIDGKKFGISAWRFNNVGGTSRNYSVMGCISGNTGGRMYLFKPPGAYYQGKPWNSGVLDDQGNSLNLCG